jgi:hypothetical protein
MREAQTVFETLMRANGYTNFKRKNNGYSDPAMHYRWKYFLLGWEMRGLK